MEIRLLDRAGTQKIYKEEMVRDFPESELKPLRAIEEMMEAGIYEPLGVYEGETLAAYAFQTVLPDRRHALIDYFAVKPAMRGTGVGTAVLAALARHYAERLAGLIIECEHPAEAPDPAIAKRRIGFYLRAGARVTAMESLVFGVHYKILALPCGGLGADSEIDGDLKELYRRMVPEPYYRGNVIFFGA